MWISGAVLVCAAYAIPVVIPCVKKELIDESWFMVPIYTKFVAICSNNIYTIITTSVSEWVMLSCCESATLSSRGVLMSDGVDDGDGVVDNDECRWWAGRLTESRPEFQTVNK